VDMHVGDVLRGMMAAYRVQGKALAGTAGMHPSELSRVLNSARQPSAMQVLRLGVALGRVVERGSVDCRQARTF